MRKPCPRPGEAFELTLDGTIPENTPLGVVRAFGYDPSSWRHNGALVTGKQKRQFMLVSIGYQSNLAEAKKTLEAKHGPTPEGQWMMAFKDEFEANGTNPVGVADPSWVGPSGDVDFPCVGSDGEPLFNWAGFNFGGLWLWLVAAPAPRE